jgi:cell division protein FtsN
MVADSIAAAARTSAKSSGVPAAKTSETSVPAASRADMSDNTARNSASGARRSQREAVEAGGGGRWTVQIAAYAARADAERLRRRLLALGYDARVVLEAPYRVRVGHFATRQSAMDVAARLKRQRFDAIVVEVETP